MMLPAAGGRVRRKSNNPAGRPVSIGGDSAAVVVPVRMSVTLRDAVDAAAVSSGQSRSDWLRAAVMLGLRSS